MWWKRLFWRLLPLLIYISAPHAAPTDAPSAASFFAPTLPGLRQGPGLNHQLHIYAGQISSDPDARKTAPTDVTAHLFFTLVKARRSADKERIMFWFNGGPGCSSFDGLMMEVGPFRLDETGEPRTVEGGWEEYINMVFVDQPAGTGYSYTSTNHFVHGPLEASRHVLQFLENFYAIFPEYRTMDMYLGGESYAGQYIPYFADAILTSDLGLPLKGAAIGNGFIDSRHQYPGYLAYAVKHGIVEMNSEHYKELKKEEDECIKAIDSISDREPVELPRCESLLQKVLKHKETKVNGKQMCVNIYDVRLMDLQPACGMNWPPEIHNVTVYLDRKDVVRAFHATAKSESWVECSGTVNSQFKHRAFNSSITVLPKVLEKIPILIFAGDQDFICNYVGLESMIHAMSWNGGNGLGTVKTQSWSVAGNPAGTWVSSRNLTYVKVFNASHMAPYDVPHVTHDMILRFVNMNFSAIVEGSARISSKVGTESKPNFVESSQSTPMPVPGAGKSPEQDKAMWEAYYNAGSAALVLVLIVLAIGTFFWCRLRRRRVQLPSQKGADEEETIPLNSSIGQSSFGGETDSYRSRKGKEKERVEEEPVIFGVGDAEDEDG